MAIQFNANLQKFNDFIEMVKQNDGLDGKQSMTSALLATKTYAD